jgi:hypothetical protein
MLLSYPAAERRRAMASRNEKNAVKEHLGIFRKKTQLPMDEALKSKLLEMIDELQSLNADYLEKGLACGGSFEAVDMRLRQLAEQTDRYARSSGGEIGHEALMGEVEKTIESISEYRRTCGR